MCKHLSRLHMTWFASFGHLSPGLDKNLNWGLHKSEDDLKKRKDDLKNEDKNKLKNEDYIQNQGTF